MDRPDELRALAALVGAEVGGAVGGIGGVHAAIAGRVFDALGGSAAPVRSVHDAIADGAYASVAAVARLGGVAAGRALALREAGDGRGVSASPRGAAALGVLNGLYGDALEAAGSDLAVPMALRVDGQTVPPAAVAGAYPDAGPRLVVLVHGLMETEHAWRLGGREAYGARLARDLGCTPLEVRYNSGRHVSENGRSLAELLAAVAVAWPVPIAQIALVGHSMGGLVARSACHQAAEAGMAWAGRVRHVVSLGTPHGGAPLAEGTHLAAHALHAVPETRPLARFLRRRSAGIRDLRHGSLVDRDWAGRDPDALRAAACAEVPLHPGATHCFVAATVTQDAGHPVARVLGDWLVLAPSASGRGRTRALPFREQDGLRVGGTHHLALLNHPAVYSALRGWLATPPQASA